MEQPEDFGGHEQMQGSGHHLITEQDQSAEDHNLAMNTLVVDQGQFMALLEEMKGLKLTLEDQQLRSKSAPTSLDADLIPLQSPPTAST